MAISKIVDKTREHQARRVVNAVIFNVVNVDNDGKEKWGFVASKESQNT